MTNEPEGPRPTRRAPRRLATIAGTAALGTAILAGGCTSILGIGGDFQLAGNGGAGGSSSSSGASSGGGLGGGGGATGGGGTGAGGGVVTRTIRGTNVPIYVTPTQEISNPVDMSPNGHHFLAALSPTPGGGFTTIPGIGLANGSFEIDDVPVGPYYLVLDKVYYGFDNDGTSPELGGYVTGRPSQTSATAPTDTTFQVTGMSPWTQGDDFQAVSFEANAATCCVPISDGDTTYGGTISWRDEVYPQPGHLLKLADTLWIEQLQASSANGIAYNSAIKSAQITGVDMPDGSSLTLSGDMTDISNIKATTLTFGISTFEGAASEVRADATPNLEFYVIDILHTTPDHGGISPSYDLLTIVLPPGTPDISNMAMTFGDPFPPSFTEICFIGFNIGVSYQLPGATPLVVSPRIFRQAVLSDCEAGPVNLDLSPPRAAEIDGHPFANDLMLAGKTPTLTWQKPSLGAPKFYVLEVGRLYIANGHTKREVVATIVTDKTSATIPPDVLQGGSVYTFVLTAVKADADYHLYPERLGLPHSRAHTMSGQLTAPN